MVFLNVNHQWLGLGAKCRKREQVIVDVRNRLSENFNGLKTS